MIFEGQVQARGDVSTGDGVYDQLRLGQSAEVFRSIAHPRYTDAVRRGNVFTCRVNGSTLSIASASVTNGLVITNPPGSPVLIALLDLAVAARNATAGSSTYGLYGATGSVTHTTPATVFNAIVGSVAVGYGLADTTATIPSNFAVVRAVGGGPVAAGSAEQPFIRDEIAGAICLLPNTCVALQLVASGAALAANISITWEEIPL